MRWIPALELSLGLLPPDPANPNNRAIILLTDGYFTDCGGDCLPLNVNIRNQILAANVRIFTVGLGNDVNSTFLQAISTTSPTALGGYYPIPTANDISKIFNSFDYLFADNGADRDGDGLTDCQELSGFQLALGGSSTIQTNPAYPDSDCDGIPDGIEVGPITLNPSTAAGTFGDPRLCDTDGDGYSDGVERIAGTNPWHAGSKPSSGPTGVCGTLNPTTGLCTWKEHNVFYFF